MQESSDTPLLDVVGLSNANISAAGQDNRATFAQITVDGYMSADAGLGWEMSSQTGIVRFNLTAPGGCLEGVTVTGAGDTPAAVVVLSGVVKNINVLQSSFAGVVDGSGVPVSVASLCLSVMKCWPQALNFIRVKSSVACLYCY